MAKLTLFTAKLEANADERTLKGRLLPFNEPGFTNLGKLTASKDSQLDVADEVILNVQHDNTRPVGKAVALETNDGIDSVFRVFATQAGNDALLEASEGVRAGLSIELEPVVIRNGHIVSGTITGAALVTKPAFESARLAAAEEGDVPDMGDEDNVAKELPTVVINDDELENVTAVEVTESKITISTEEERKDEEVTANVTNPALAAGLVKPNTDKNMLFAAMANASRTGQKMEAALSDIVPTNILGIEQPQYVGQLWNGKAYQRKIIPLFNHAELTALKINGWKWVTKPTVGLYAGNKTAIPSGAVLTEATEVVAQRIAGGHDIDRKFVDFGDTEFLEAYFAAMTESYAKVSDAYALGEIVDAATAVIGGTVPSGIAAGLAYIVDGALAVQEATDTAADFALVASDLWRAVVLTKDSDTLGYLSAAIGMEDGSLGSFTIRPTSALEAGQVLVGSKSAVTVHELGGEAPIRVSAEDIAKGGRDEALFGYVAVNVHNEEGLALVEAA